MRAALRNSLYAGAAALSLAACGEAGEDDAERAAREAADAAQSAGEAIEEGWRSGDDERGEIAEETGEAVEAVAAQVRSEWAAARDERRAALETAGDHVGAAGAALAEGFEAAAEAYAANVDDGVDIADFRGREPDFDRFAYQDEPVGDAPLDGSIALDEESDPVLAGDAIDRDDGDREYVPSHELDVEPHPCAEHDHETCDHTDAEHARCTPERG